MDKLIVKYKSKEEPSVFNIVTFLKNNSKSKEVLFSNVEDLINHPLVEWYEIASANVNRGEGSGQEFHSIGGAVDNPFAGDDA